MKHTSTINIRDPFVLPYEGKYYMYGSRVGGQKGFDVYISDDLKHWGGPVSVFEYFYGFWGEKDFWAPEVHRYQGRFYMFATFKNEKCCRGTAILVSDSPEGPFVDHSKGPVTPLDWECLDGTFFVTPEGKPYIIFCHEWLQIGDGTVCAVELSKDLTHVVSEPVVLWRGSDASWGKSLVGGPHEKDYVTDGPFLISSGDELVALWSGFDKNGYVEAVSRSNDGTITGKWSVDDALLFDGDGGHGMVFKTFDGQQKFVCHRPNIPFEERPYFMDFSFPAK